MTSTIGRKHISYSLISVTTKEERLLAVAPEMLRVLKLLVSGTDLAGSIEGAIAVIAKAKGKE